MTDETLDAELTLYVISICNFACPSKKLKEKRFKKQASQIIFQELEFNDGHLSASLPSASQRFKFEKLSNIKLCSLIEILLASAKS